MKIIAGQKSLALSNPLASSPDAFSVYTIKSRMVLSSSTQ